MKEVLALRESNSKLNKKVESKCSAKLSTDEEEAVRLEGVC